MEKIVTKILEIMSKDVFWNVLLGLITLLTTLAGAKSYKDRKKRFLITYNPKYVVDNSNYINEHDLKELEIRQTKADTGNTEHKTLHRPTKRTRKEEK